MTSKIIKFLRVAQALRRDFRINPRKRVCMERVGSITAVFPDIFKTPTIFGPVKIFPFSRYRRLLE